MEGHGNVSSCGSTEIFLCAIVALVVLRVELQRGWSGSGSRATQGGGSGNSYAQSCKRILRCCVPEGTGLIALLVIAAFLRLREGQEAPADSAAYAAWIKIKADWPLLMGADTLLALQAMLRLLVLLSAACRTGMNGAPMPLGDEAASLWLGSAVARTVLYTRSPAYHIDGPLGGKLPAVCDMVSIAPLLFLSRKTFFRAPFTVGSTAAATILYAVRNHVGLSGDYITDSLFTLAHAYDFFAACAYVLRGFLIDQRTKRRKELVAIGFAHILMPIQAILSAYFFLTAFDAVPDLVGAGMPFEVLKVSTCVQFGAYSLAAAVYFADLLQGAGENAVGLSTSRSSLM